MTTRSERLTPPTAKWGAACAPCSTAKAKCIRSNPASSSKCDRCQRLFKACSGQVHRPRKKRQVKPSRTAQIEERLNGLVSLLKASGDIPAAELASEVAAVKAAGRCSSAGQDTPSTSSPASLYSGGHSWSVPETYNSFAPPSCICRPETGEAPPPPDNDEALLSIYRNELQRVYPFVLIPPHTSAATLGSTRPFLMSCIRMVASFKSIRSMRAQMYHLMKYLAEHILIRSEKSLDLLLGIIVIAGWYQYHCFMHAQLNNLLAMAATLVGELGLNRHPVAGDTSFLTRLKPVDLGRRTNEERRALLAVWFLTSTMSISFFKVESMRYTNYMQECVTELDIRRECDTDIALTYMIRAQHLTERIYQLDAKDQALEQVSEIPSAPMSVYVSAFQSELDRLRESMPEWLKADRVYMTYLNTAALRLYEPPVIDSGLIHSITEALSVTGTGPGESPLSRIYQAKNTLSTWFENWLEIPATTYYCLPSPVAAQLIYGCTMLGRWAKLATPQKMFADRSSMPPSPDSTLRGTESLTSTATSPGLSPLPGRTDDKGPCISDQNSLRMGSDPGLPTAVAMLRSRLKKQRGLRIDVPELLNRICTRFDQANETMQMSLNEDGKMDETVWSVGAVRVRLSRARLEHWAGLVSQGTEILSLQEGLGPRFDESIAGMAAAGSNGSDVSGVQGFGLPGDLPADLTLQQLPESSQQQWGPDSLQHVDPSLWFNGYFDWETVMADIEQPEPGPL